MFDIFFSSPLYLSFTTFLPLPHCSIAGLCTQRLLLNQSTSLVSFHIHFRSLCPAWSREKSGLTYMTPTDIDCQRKGDPTLYSCEVDSCKTSCRSLRLKSPRLTTLKCVVGESVLLTPWFWDFGSHRPNTCFGYWMRPGQNPDLRYVLHWQRHCPWAFLFFFEIHLLLFLLHVAHHRRLMETAQIILSWISTFFSGKLSWLTCLIVQKTAQRYFRILKTRWYINAKLSLKALVSCRFCCSSNKDPECEMIDRVAIYSSRLLFLHVPNIVYTCWLCGPT